MPIWVTGDESELNGYLLDGLRHVTQELRHVPVASLLDDAKMIDGALVVAGFRTITDQTQHLVQKLERGLGAGRLLVFTSEEGKFPRGIFSWNSVDQTVLNYLIESEIEQIKLKTWASDAETERFAALRMSTELISSMAHDLRAPLNSINGFAELLQSEAAGPLSEKQIRYATNIATSGRTLLGLIDEIVDLSKIDTGNASLEIESVEVGSLINDAIVPLREKAQKRGVTIVLDSNQGTGEIVSVDRRRIRQAIHLLVSFQLESGMHGEHLVISVDENETGPRLRMELERDADATFVTKTARSNAQSMWKKRYVERVLKMHGAGLVEWSDEKHRQGRVEIQFRRQPDIKLR